MQSDQNPNVDSVEGGTDSIDQYYKELDTKMEDNLIPSSANDRVHLLRLLPNMLPQGLQNRPSKMSAATQFHHGQWMTT